MRTFGLIGKKLNHSFSSKYFNNKFLREGIYDAQYINFEINDISKIRDLIKENKVTGLNITIPYKESVVPFLDELSTSAKNISTDDLIRATEEQSYAVTALPATNIILSLDDSQIDTTNNVKQGVAVTMISRVKDD